MDKERVTMERIVVHDDLTRFNQDKLDFHDTGPADQEFCVGEMTLH